MKAAHTKWLASLEQSKKVAARFIEGPEDNDNAIAQAIVKRLDSYRDQFAHVARQLEAGGLRHGHHCQPHERQGGGRV